MSVEGLANDFGVASARDDVGLEWLAELEAHYDRPSVIAELPTGDDLAAELRPRNLTRPRPPPGRGTSGRNESTSTTGAPQSDDSGLLASGESGLRRYDHQ